MPGKESSCDDRIASHGLDFFRSWLSDPLKVASIVPSGRMLAQRMATGIRAGSTVIELGAGTGTLTRAIRDAGVTDARLHLVEQSEVFARILERQFPAVRTYRLDAESIDFAMPELVGTVDSVISGLPILWFPRAKKRRILEAVFRMLRPGGFYQQFTYLGRPPVGARLRVEAGIEARLVALAPLNLPPAFVYRFRRSSESQR